MVHTVRIMQSGNLTEFKLQRFGNHPSQLFAVLKDKLNASMKQYKNICSTVSQLAIHFIPQLNMQNFICVVGYVYVHYVT